LVSSIFGHEELLHGVNFIFGQNNLHLTLYSGLKLFSREHLVVVMIIFAEYFVNCDPNSFHHSGQRLDYVLDTSLELLLLFLHSEERMEVLKLDLIRHLLSR
jgi:hypothetical protein